VSRQFEKDPDAILDYTVDWSRWLGTDTILASQWTVPTGLTQVSSSNTSTSATVWLSGGTAGQAYTVTNRITTAGGRTDERSIVINVRDR
jgi:hypothetical protein